MLQIFGKRLKIPSPLILKSANSLLYARVTHHHYHQLTKPPSRKIDITVYAQDAPYSKAYNVLERNSDYSRFLRCNRTPCQEENRVPRLSKRQEALLPTRIQMYRKLIVCGSMQLSGSGARSPVLPS